MQCLGSVGSQCTEEKAGRPDEPEGEAVDLAIHDDALTIVSDGAALLHDTDLSGEPIGNEVGSEVIGEPLLIAEGACETCDLLAGLVHDHRIDRRCSSRAATNPAKPPTMTTGACLFGIGAQGVACHGVPRGPRTEVH